jgi:hypothetical protein
MRQGIGDQTSAAPDVREQALASIRVWNSAQQISLNDALSTSVASKFILTALSMTHIGRDCL